MKKIIIPLRFALLYLVLIFVFAIIYYCNYEQFKTNLPNTFLTSLYFSTITITTVGYGDISPVGVCAIWCVIVESISGILIIGFLLNELSQLQSRKITEREKELNEKELLKNNIAKLLRYDKLIQQDIEFYNEYTYIITTPISGRTHDGAINRNFNFNDLSDLYNPSLRLSDSLFEPAIKYFFIHQTNLINDIKNLLHNVELNDWNELENIIIDFLELNKEMDFKDGILSLSDSMQGDKKSSDIFSNYISEHTCDLKFTGANMMNLFVGLYHLIKSNLIFVDKYQAQIAEIRNQLTTCN